VVLCASFKNNKKKGKEKWLEMFHRGRITCTVKPKKKRGLKKIDPDCCR
jgi:hypothetical protein